MKLPRPLTALVTSVALTTGLVVAAPTASAETFTWVNRDGETCTMDHLLTDEEAAQLRQEIRERYEEARRKIALATSTVDILKVNRQLYLDLVKFAKRLGCPVESTKTAYISDLQKLASNTDKDDEVGLFAIRSELMKLGMSFTKAKELTLTASEKKRRKVTQINQQIVQKRAEEEANEVSSSELLPILLPVVGGLALVALAYGILTGQMVNHIKANPSLYPNSPHVKK